MSNVKLIQQFTPTVMSGTGHDVIEQLHRSPNRRTVAVSFADDEQVAADGSRLPWIRCMKATFATDFE